MSQRVSHYVLLGNQDAKIVTSGFNGSFYKYLLYSMTSLVGKLFFLSFPIFALSDYHIVQQIRYQKQWRFKDAFEDAKFDKKFYATLQFALIQTAVFVTAILIITGISFGLVEVSQMIDRAFSYSQSYALFIAQVLIGCMIITFLVSYQVHFGPIMYLIQKQDDIHLSDAFKQSALIMSGDQKTKLLGLNFYYILKVLLAGIVTFIIALISYNQFNFLLFVIIVLILGLLLIKSMLKNLLASKLASTRLYDDLIQEIAYENLGDVKVHKMMEKVIRKEDVLRKLFDGIQSESMEEKVITPLVNVGEAIKAQTPPVETPVSLKKVDSTVDEKKPVLESKVAKPQEHPITEQPIHEPTRDQEKGLDTVNHGTKNETNSTINNVQVQENESQENTESKPSIEEKKEVSTEKQEKPSKSTKSPGELKWNTIKFEDDL